MGLILVGTPTSAVGTGTTCALNVPQAPVYGQALVWFITADTVVTFAKPSAATLIDTQSDSAAGNDQIIGAWWRPCDGSEAGSFAWTFASNAFSGGCLLIGSDAGGTVSLDTSSKGQGAASTASIVCPGLTAATRNELLVAGFALDVSPSGAVTHTPPGTMTERIDVNSGTWAAIEICTELFAGPGATGTRTATASISSANGTIAIMAAFQEILAAAASGILMGQALL